LCAIVVALLLAPAMAAQAATEAHIVETQPAADATLGRQQSFWVHMEYSTDETVSLWARPYRDGKQVTKAMSNASLSYTGMGEALGWFALTEPGEVDEIRVIAGGGKPYREWELQREAVHLRWSADQATNEPQAAWVTELLAVEKARRDEEFRQRANEPVSTGSVALFGGFMLLVLAVLIAGIVVPLWSVWKWRGGWRIAAALPAAAIGFVVLRILIGTAVDPTSHNLWPFEILQVGVVALVVIGVLALVRRIRGVRQ
jgi:hypothetical protein